ncbi:50S ribosomal protein L28 [Candidatus Peregrinibacteria bacterium CG11_big_fil_rev_8_21_14_0_20_46_8]|nr:MAG: 50S ribosomal protein L28 [Candidatus Peregrinibacteria bacterium CG11_big_fil_rev_8_21_14_0_20_46_8]
MAQICDGCGKRPQVGNLVSHSNRKTLRTFRPNLQSQKVVDIDTGKMKRMKLCTKCLKTLTRKANAVV